MPWEIERQRLEALVERDLRRHCEDNGKPYWTEKELAELPEYREGNTAVPHPVIKSWRDLKQAIRKKYKGEFDAVEDSLRSPRRRYEDLQDEIAHEERKRDLNWARYDAELARYGASLDPSRMSFLSVVDFQPESGSLPDFVLPGLPIGNVGCLVGPPGKGKTQYMTQLGLDIACGRDGLAKGGVLYVYGEDDQPSHELRRDAALARLSPNERADVCANFLAWYLEGKRADLTDPQSEGALAFRWNIRKIEQRFRRNGVQLRLIVLDSLSIFNAGKENQPEQAAALLDTLRQLCLETGAALVFLHHTTKASLSGDNGAESLRGHSILGANVRWVTILSGMNEREATKLGVNSIERHEFVKIELVKCHYLPPQKPRWLRFDGHGIILPADLPVSDGHSAKPEFVREGLTTTDALKPEPDEGALLQPEPVESVFVAAPDLSARDSKGISSAPKPGKPGSSRFEIDFGGRNAQQRQA